MTSGPAHLARAGVLGTTALALAVGGHVAAGGEAPGLLGLTVLAVLTCAAVLVLTLRRLGVVALVGSLGILQLALHVGLIFASAGGTATVVGGSAHGGHHQHVALAVTGAGSSSHDLAMTLAHVVATLLTALLLARAESLAWLAASIVTPLLPRTIAAARAALAGLHLPAAPAPVEPPRLVQLHWATAARRRGPPALV